MSVAHVAMQMPSIEDVHKANRLSDILYITSSISSKAGLWMLASAVLPPGKQGH